MFSLGLIVKPLGHTADELSAVSNVLMISHWKKLKERPHDSPRSLTIARSADGDSTASAKMLLSKKQMFRPQDKMSTIALEPRQNKTEARRSPCRTPSPESI